VRIFLVKSGEKMPGKTRQRVGLTLSETVVSVAIIGIMIAVSIPAVQILQESLHSSGAKSMISSALSAARALAARHQKYAGIRFQFDSNGINQYMIFILHDKANLGIVNGFRAIDGLKPVKLPENLGVMDLRIVNRYKSGVAEIKFTEMEITTDNMINDERNLRDTTTFSIIFTPAGKLVIHNVRVRNIDGQQDTIANIPNDSGDDIFNKKAKVDARQAMFYQDDYFGAPHINNNYGDLGLGPELSRSSFIIYNKNDFGKVPWDSRWTDYLQYLKVFYINSYTGTIIE
jgi:Tfp pilus assembly protein FimT